MSIVVGQFGRAARGETVSGDATLVRAMDDATLLAVVDGLGHGKAASEAAQRAIATLREAPAALDLAGLLHACDRALRGSRGAALTLVRVEGTRIAAGGVGNVALRTRDVDGLSFLAMPGIVGALRRSPRVAEGKLGPRARIVLASDGISSRFDLAQLEHLAPQAAADELALRHGVEHDDVSVLVVDLTVD